MSKYPNFFDLNGIEASITTDDLRNELSVDSSQLHEAIEVMKLRIDTIPDQQTEEDDYSFGKELFGALMSAAEYLYNNTNINPNVRALMTTTLTKLVLLEEIAHGTNEALDRYNKLIEFNSLQGPQAPPPWMINSIPLVPERFPYPISDQFDAKACIGQLHKYFLETERIDCTLQEFERHVLLGDVSSKIKWKQNIFEIAWFHKLLTGNYEGVKGMEFLTSRNIHTLAAAHFHDKNGDELSTDSLSSLLQKGSFNPAKDPFVAAFSEVTQKFAKLIN